MFRLFRFPLQKGNLSIFSAVSRSLICRAVLRIDCDERDIVLNAVLQMPTYNSTFDSMVNAQSEFRQILEQSVGQDYSILVFIIL